MGVSPCVLAVDDEAAALRILTLQLVQRGARVVAAHDGPDALRLAEEEHPDVAVVDVRMPGMNGIDILRSLKARYSIPVIMITAAPNEADRRASLEAGAEAYLAKPIDPDDLYQQVRNALRGH